LFGDIVRAVELTGGRRPALTFIPTHPANPSGAALTAISSRGEILMIKLMIGPPAWVRVFTMIVLGAALWFLMAASIAQAQRKASEDDSAVFHDYRGIQLGMSADEVRKKLGEPKDKADEQDFYIFGETETAQIVYDKTHKVITISADFLTAATSIPTSKQVFGAEVEAKGDGSVYKMVRFPKAGYWLSYNRTSGNSPLTTVTLQKIQ
jgi:hypothetical protein